VGYGSGREAAEKNALANLTAIFGQSIKSDSSFTTTYTEAVQKSSVEWQENTGTVQAIKTQVAMDSLVGAEIKDVWDSRKGTVYAVAAMDKNTSSVLYTEMVMQNQATISKLTGISASEKNSFEGYAKYLKAADLADANAVFLNVLTVLNGAPSAQAKKGEDLRVEAAEIAKNIPISVTVENDKSGKIKTAFSQALSQAGFRTGADAPAARYQLKAKLSLEEAVFDGSPYKWYRYAVEGSLTDTASNTVLFPYDGSGREGANTLPEAETRAVKSAENAIKESYVKALGDFLAQASGKGK
jgi:hypothetical protein